MSQTISTNGQVTLINNNLRTTLNLVSTATTTGSNSIMNNANVVTGSWAQLDQASNTDYRYGFYANLSLTSSIKIAINSAGTSSWAAYLFPGDVAMIPNSGSSLVFVQATGSESPAILQYILSER